MFTRRAGRLQYVPGDAVSPGFCGSIMEFAMYMIGFYGRLIGSDGVMHWIYTHINNDPEKFAGRDYPDDDPAAMEIYSKYEHISGFISVSHARYVSESLADDKKVKVEPSVMFVVNDAGDGRAWAESDRRQGIQPLDRVVRWPAKYSGDRPLDARFWVSVVVRSFLPNTRIDDDREAVQLALDYLFEVRAKDPTIDRLCGAPGAPGYSLPPVSVV